MTTKFAASEILNRLPLKAPLIAFRVPEVSNAARWKKHVIDGRMYEVAQPVTFTPYASAAPCSARCRFCSETLIERVGGKPSSAIRPREEYFDQLQLALRQLTGLPLSYSLSGLETTDDPEWMLQLLNVLRDHAQISPVEERVLYTNGAGFADPRYGNTLISHVADFGLDWIELSRHHFDEEANQEIMRFHPGIDIRFQAQFHDALQRLSADLPVKLICIVQDKGIDSKEAVLAYLDWAAAHGARAVIFREFSKLDGRYKDNVTAGYIRSSRVAVDALLEQCMGLPAFRNEFRFDRVTQGYYFWNIVGRYRGIEVVFESSDYAMMHRMHESGRIYKLVFHANGNLCADWNPQRHVLWRARP
ncbi:MAG: hypothetical protein HYS18_04370 [Burkholderiales bacterium]|nr:hypothetical protein [Burkholderiales bacterium]